MLPGGPVGWDASSDEARRAQTGVSGAAYAAPGEVWENARMTEAEWLAGTDPRQMLEFVGDKTTERKLRLFAVACVQRYSDTDGAMRQIVSVSELYADGITTWNDLASVRKLAKGLSRRAMQTHVGMGAGAVRHAASVAHPSAVAAAEGVLPSVVAEVATHAIREVFGSPFRPVSIEPAWLAWNDSTVVKLAQSIYADRRFDRLPTLADALEDAGCTNTDILAHCRVPGVHVRGCWVVDLLLGKE
jgi:hypothetical protein